MSSVTIGESTSGDDVNGSSPSSAAAEEAARLSDMTAKTQARVGALKILEAERSLLNADLKQIGTCEDVASIGDFFEELEDVLSPETLGLERLIPNLRSRFKLTARAIYTSAVSSELYRDARVQKLWTLSWTQFKAGCLGLSQDSLDSILHEILGGGFQHGVVEGQYDASETLEQCTIRWNQLLQKSKLVLGVLFAPIQTLGKELFKSRVRTDYRSWFITNRKQQWESSGTTLYALAVEAKVYEGTEPHLAKGAVLETGYKKGGGQALVCSVGGKQPGHKAAYSDGRNSVCYMCGEVGHYAKDCKMVEFMRKLYKERDSGNSNSKASVAHLSSRLSDAEQEIRQDLAAIACSASVDRMLLTERARDELA